ncbi:MAG: VCBS repeat-containing protein, partial [Xanthomonadaceae bacterium]|nr:VCBS repeat-containing protein [Xanthomonadaceae bacterium]
MAVAAMIYTGFPVAAGQSLEFVFQPTLIAVFQPSPGMGTGLAAADYDADGDPDIFVPTAAGMPNLLFRNRGDGQFDEVASQSGLADLRQARAALWLDYDGDGDLDLFVARDCFADGRNAPGTGLCSERVLSLFENRGGQFVEISEQVGLFTAAGQLTGGFHAGGLSAGDLSGDGLPDLYAARWQAVPELYVSDSLFSGGKGSGYSLGSGLTPIADVQAGYWQGLIHDFDRDGRPDLFVNVDFSANQLWMNRGALVMENSAADAGAASSWNEMGVAPGDYDNDGDLDLFVSNIFDWLGPSAGSHNLMLQNQSGAGLIAFNERAVERGLDDAGWGWGATWLDADNDGDLDLAVTNGYCQPAPDVCPSRFDDDRSKFFINPGDGRSFAEVGALVGFDDALIGGGLVAADFDGDGRLDLLQTAIDPATSVDPLQRSERLTLYFNRPTEIGPAGAYVVVRPRMAGLNSHALGARARLFLTDGTI